MNPLHRHPNSLHNSTGNVNVGRLLGYLSSAIVLSAMATVTCGTTDEQRRLPLQPPTAVVVTSGDVPAVRVRRQSFSMIQDLDALAEMLREATHRRKMQSALDFFNGLRKRDDKRASAHDNDNGNSSDNSSASLTQTTEQLLMEVVAATADDTTSHQDGEIVPDRPLVQVQNDG